MIHRHICQATNREVNEWSDEIKDDDSLIAVISHYVSPSIVIPHLHKNLFVFKMEPLGLYMILAWTWFVAS